MNVPMRNQDLRTWVDGWKEVARAETAELRALTPEVKLRQLDALAQSASLFEWSSAEDEDDRVRELWISLRRRSGIR